MNGFLALAVCIATKAHQGQKDKYGQPYILHPTRVMNMGRTIEEKIVGILHDVVEDTEWTFDDLSEKGFPAEIMNALHCVTKANNELYDDYIERCASNSLAIAVKIHDLIDNMDVRRMTVVGSTETERLNKYLKAYHRLFPLYK